MQLSMFSNGHGALQNMVARSACRDMSNNKNLCRRTRVIPIHTRRISADNANVLVRVAQ